MTHRGRYIECPECRLEPRSVAEHELGIEREVERLRIEAGETALVLEQQDRTLHRMAAERDALERDCDRIENDRDTNTLLVVLEQARGATKAVRDTARAVPLAHDVECAMVSLEDALVEYEKHCSTPPSTAPLRRHRDKWRRYAKHLREYARRLKRDLAEERIQTELAHGVLDDVNAKLGQQEALRARVAELEEALADVLTGTCEVVGRWCLTHGTNECHQRAARAVLEKT